jgi:hypothetical protein
MTHDLEFHKSIATAPCNTLKLHPIRCGLLIYDANLELRSSGLSLERSTGQICIMAHLYVATRLIAPDSPKWPDMEFLIEQQDETRLFFGGRPKTLEECVRKVYLMMGRSAADRWRIGRVKKKGVNSEKTSKKRNKDGRWLDETSILTPIFKPRSYGWSTTNASVDDQVKLLSNTLRSPTEIARLAKKLNKPVGQVKLELEERRWRPYFEETQNNENGSTALLRDLSMWLEGDAVDLYWSWQAIQNQCGKVWQKFVSSLSAEPEWDHDWNRHPRMGVHILEVAAADEHEKGGITKDDPEFAASLRHCLDAITAIISEVQQEPATILGIFSVQQDTKGSYIYGGDVCLNRLLKEDTNFVNYLRGSDGRKVISMYMPWAGETFFKTRIYRLLELYIEDAEAEIQRLTRKNMRIWIESE